MDEPQVRKKLGKKIVALRQAAGMTQDDLAGASGLTVEAISRLERSERAPRLGTLIKVASGLGIQIVELFEFQDERPKAQALRADVAELADLLRHRPRSEVQLVYRITELVVASELLLNR